MNQGINADRICNEHSWKEKGNENSTWKRLVRSEIGGAPLRSELELEDGDAVAEALWEWESAAIEFPSSPTSLSRSPMHNRGPPIPLIFS